MQADPDITTMDGSTDGTAAAQKFFTDNPAFVTDFVNAITPVYTLMGGALSPSPSSYIKSN